MYILIIEWTSYEKTLYEFVTLKDLKEYVKKNHYLLEQKYYIARVLATETSTLDGLKDD